MEYGLRCVYSVENLSIQFPGIIHSQFGTITHLHDLVSAAHAANIAVFLEVNWSLFDSNSILYDVDCSGGVGAFLHSYASDRIGKRYRFDYNTLKQGLEYVRLILNRWYDEAAIDGIVWNDVGCILYGGQLCQEGLGAIDSDGVNFLQTLFVNSSMIHVQ